MQTRLQPGLRLAILAALAAIGVSTVSTAASAPVDAEVDLAPSSGMKTWCFMLPVRPGESVSDTWCVRAPVGTPVATLLLDAPGRGSGGIGDVPATDYVTLGFDYDQANMGGDSLEWTGANTCAPGRSYIGNTPSWFANRASSAKIGASSGCWTFRHYDNPNQTGNYVDCTTNQNCEGNRLYIQGLDNKTESVLFFY